MISDFNSTKGQKLNAKFGKMKILEIQQRKSAMDMDDRLLVDGTLPKPGLFDGPAETIAMACKASETWQTLQMMYNLIIMKAPKTVIELGTNLGFSSSYIGSALKTLGQGGHLYTIDASPYKIKIAKQLHADLGLDNITHYAGLFDDVLPGILADLSSVDMAFIDGDHILKPTLNYFDMIAAKTPSGSCILFDDILVYSDDMRQAWSTITKHNRVHSWSEFGDIGMIITNGE